MNESDWIDAKTACALLGVKPQTLYAYVSRKQIKVRSDQGDARQSLYSRADIQMLARQHRRPRARADVAQAAIRWGDPVLITSISEVRDGMLWLRGQSVDHCADWMSLEQVAALLCDTQAITCAAPAPQIMGRSVFSRAMRVLASETETARPMQGRSAKDILEEAGPLISRLADVCLGQVATGAIHTRFGTVWGLDTIGEDAVRRALVLLSDHELNPSTFAVRVCASTGASLPAALLAGMSTLSGPRHGGVANLAGAALKAALEGQIPAFLRSQPKTSPYAYGFGHPLYPQGDPRAKHILHRLPEQAPSRCAAERLATRLKRPANIDAALAALALHYACPSEAATTIFAVGRVTGWVAHAIEQVQSDGLIRPRARYQAKPS